MHTRLCAAVVMSLLALSQHAPGAVQLQLSLVNTPSGSVLNPGDSATVVVSAAAGGDSFNSAIFRMVWSRPGVALTGYQWGSPFITGNAFDDSTPAAGTLPVTITNSLLSGFGYDPDVADVEFSNVVPPPAAPGAPGTFTAGELLRLTFRVPVAFDEGQLLLRLVSDTFAQGATGRQVDPGQGIVFIVVPTPGAAALGLITAVGLSSRRRRDRSMTPTA